MPDRRERLELQRQFRAALMIPVTIVAVTTLLLWMQIHRQAEDAEWLDHTDAVLAQAQRTARGAIDQETGLRGYMLTGDDQFLQPYHLARPGDGLTELRRLVEDNPAQVARVDAIRGAYDYWLTHRARVVLESRAKATSLEEMREAKRQMDVLRDAFDEFERAELELRASRSVTNAATRRNTWLAFIAFGVLASASLALGSRRQISGLASMYDGILNRERALREEAEAERWTREGQRTVVERLLNPSSLATLCQGALEHIVTYTGAAGAAAFVREADGLERAAVVGLGGDNVPAKLGLDEGLVGRAASGKAGQLFTEVNGGAGAIRFRSGVADIVPQSLVAIPAWADGQVQAVIELAFTRPIDAKLEALLSRVGEPIGNAVHSERQSRRVRDLLHASQRQAEEMQTQQEELRAINEELEQQSVALREAHHTLSQRQEVIEAINARLEERALELDQSREAFRTKAEEADRANKFKSEFVANMSHELRTPLNSTLILAKLLADNQEKNLNEEQVRYAETIYSAGNDLLTLINDILDLAKVEAGGIVLEKAPVALTDVVDTLKRTFVPIAQNKHVKLEMSIERGLPATITTDGHRLLQVLRNLLSNAIKFTDDGRVAVRVRLDGERVAFEVEDTGIGIAPEQIGMIFEPFRQADGTTSRKYGGTGLGLSISRELASLLGGSIEVKSVEGKGSTFTLRVPQHSNGVEDRVLRDRASSPPPPPAPAPLPSAHRPRTQPPASSPVVSLLPDDRASLRKGDPTLLVVEDDLALASILYDLSKQRGFQCIIASDALSALSLVNETSPTGVLLDVNLPDHSGLFVLDRMKHTPATQHIPVHVFSVDDHASRARRMGAVGFLQKPATPDALVQVMERLLGPKSSTARTLLVVDPDEAMRASIAELLQSDGVEILTAATLAQASDLARGRKIQGVVSELTLGDGSAIDLVNALSRDRDVPPPVVIHTSKMPTTQEQDELQRRSAAVILKGPASAERLADEVTGLLDRDTAVPTSSRGAREDDLANKTVLIVEDDVRNVFALTKVLEAKGARTVIARNGLEALARLEEHHDVALVLMDVMMPEMDGLEATRRIRQMPQWARLPVIALTAKAMPDDRKACLDAGANDYVPKPIDVERLLSLCRIWIQR